MKKLLINIMVIIICGFIYGVAITMNGDVAAIVRVMCLMIVINIGRSCRGKKFKKEK